MCNEWGCVGTNVGKNSMALVNKIVQARLDMVDKVRAMRHASSLARLSGLDWSQTMYKLCEV
ncbi:hypothetical protein GCM10022198_07540 [Klugiella xanthotipulae]